MHAPLPKAIAPFALTAALACAVGVEPAAAPGEAGVGIETGVIVPAEPAFGVEGFYELIEVGDSTLPAPVDLIADCQVRVVTAALALRQERFSLTATTNESCGAGTRTRARNAGGSYRVQADGLEFVVDPGAPVTRAEAATDSDSTLVVSRVYTVAATRDVRWLFRKQPAAAPVIPPPQP